jgi:hypothetical protein
MATAKEQVLAMPELMDSILLQLPLQELLVNAQRVSRTWKSIIKLSPLLQQKLFFQPWPSNSIWPHKFNPILRERFWRWFPMHPGESYDITFCWLPGPIDWNRNHHCCDYGHCENCDVVDSNHAAHAKEVTRKKQEAYARKEASWRRMLPVQPAHVVFEVESKWRHYFGSTTSIGEVEFPDGVRMGTLYDYSQRTVLNPLSSFGVEWQHPSQEKGRGEVKGKVRISAWSPSQPSVIESESDLEDGVSATEDLKSQTGRDLCGPLYQSMGYEELDINLKVVSIEEHENANERLREWITSKSPWTPRLGA